MAMRKASTLVLRAAELRNPEIQARVQAEMQHADHAAARCGALPSDYASHRGLALASVLHRLHAAGAPAR